MSKPMPWRNSLNAKLGGSTLVLLVLSLILVFGNIYMLSRIKTDMATTSITARKRMHAYHLLFLARKLFEQSSDARATARQELVEVMGDIERRYAIMRHGDRQLGIPPTTDLRVRATLADREEFWRTRLEPEFQRLAVESATGAAHTDFSEIDREMSIFIEMVDRGIDVYQSISEAEIRAFQVTQYLFVGGVLVILGLVFWITRGIAGRVRTLATTAERIAGGELGLAAPVAGTDELAMLGESFNAMTAKLRTMIDTEKAARTEIETLAAAVSETVTTVDEVTSTADQAAQRAKTVANASQRSMEIGKVGRRAVEDSVVGMGTVRDQVESIAESIVALAEQAQAIGEIIATVNDIAEQTNLLALNAGIEASRAGEHGRGFQVVAIEVKALADQAKKATGQVRQILGEIQKATNSAVMATEHGQKSVNSTMRLVSQAGDTIKSMTDTIAETAQAAAQIAASAGQQAAGLAQIHQAMKNINQATNRNLASARQQERLKGLLAVQGR